MSGGAAKGVAHIGMLQALEENGIPIDYVAGTSMGAIVSGLYAIGLSPQEMLDMIKSKDFNNWMTGTVDNEFINFFGKPDPKPDIINTSISLTDTVFKTGKILPTSLYDPIQMNFAFLELFTQYTAACRGDFNQLMVPFRCVAADVNNRSPFIMKNGDLGDAIRASMSFPFVFKAIKIDGKLLYDGGIYNNYPVDVMIKDFNPDRMIGSVVTNNKEDLEDYDMAGQLVNMIMQPSNYDIPEGKGLQMNFDLSKVPLFDFYKADSIFKIGYEGTIARIDEIKKLISRRVDPMSIRLKRAVFRSKIPALRFREIIVNGTTETQKEYLMKVLGHDGKDIFSLQEFKEGYFKLLSDKKISEIRPHALFNPADSSYKLILDVEIKNNIDIAIGANISSSTSNQIYLGVGYKILNQFAQNYNADAYMGKILNAFSLSSTFKFTEKLPQYFKLELTNLNYNYFQDNRLFYQEDQPAFIKQHEFFLRSKYGLPAFKNGKIEIGLAGGILYDKYMQTQLESFSDKNFDRSTYSILNFSSIYENNTLNDKQYPVSGKRNFLTFQYLLGIESYQYPDSTGYLSKDDKGLSYFQLSGGLEYYSPINDNWILGTKAEFVFNNKRLLDNYSASIIQAPAFAPTLHSKSIFNEGYRSNQYMALGITPIWKINPSMFLRSEAYGFFPLTMIKPAADRIAINNHSWSNIKYIAEVALVYQLPFTSLSLFINNYSYPKGNWNFGVNIGYLLFGKRFIEL